jgi:vacuolar-type H+-ATPase subunit H
VSDPLLKRVAAHERSLLAQIKNAHAEAQGVVERARAEARALREADEQELSGEVMLFRRDADAVRVKEYDEVVRKAQQETEKDRTRVAQHVSSAAADVLAMILPGGSA